ncbi:hypothetical protein Daus18300_001072 [Diaporthe australafricana]|uniref:FAD-binding PCMH-type domain-containing protein n=1 Tax=Diaporthe australafricana TaxID=127596 RepID=A0ABR3XYX6_9PEZI
MAPQSIRMMALFLGLVQASSFLNLTSLYGSGLSPGAEIFYASDPSFGSEATPRWTVIDAPSFYGAIKPATESDVQHIVKVSVAHDIPFLATGAGHGASSTLARLQEGVQIDLSSFKTVQLDASNNVLQVGGAAVFSQLYDPLFEAGKELPLGNAKCVGVIGATLGGTVGIFQGLYGLGLDSLKSVRLVTATGDLLTASATQNADLFWGIRGAGANFGIVLSATFEVHDAPNGGILTSSDFLFPPSANESVWEALKTFDDDIPDELAIYTYIIFNATAQVPLIAVNAIYHGPSSEASKYMAPFIAAGPLMTDAVETPWTKWSDVALFGLAAADTSSCTPGQHSNGYGVGIKQTDVATFVSFFNSLAQFWVDHPSLSGTVVVERLPNRVVASVPDSSTAYGHRGIKTHILLENYYNDTALDAEVNDFNRAARAQFQATSGLDQLSVYVNFAHGDEGPGVWYSEQKLPGLTRLKRQWDPQQAFSWYFPVPLR